MKVGRKIVGATFVLFLAMAFSNNFLAAQDATGKPTIKEVSQKIQKLQIPFIENEGQSDERVKYYANTFGGTVFVTKEGEIIYALAKSGSAMADGQKELLSYALCRISSPRNTLYPRSRIFDYFADTPYEDGHYGKSLVLKEELLGERAGGIKGEGEAETKVSYFKGNDSSKWKSSLSTYEVVNLGEVYEGIELKLKAYGKNVEKLFCVKPNTNPDMIKVKLEGAKSLRVNGEGQLEAETELGTVAFTKPIAYQEIDGNRVDVETSYVIRDRETSLAQQTATDNGHGSRTYGFTVASYDTTKDLIIDPLLASTFLGGSDNDYTSNSHCLTIDGNGNVYVTGFTHSSNFPTTSGVYDTSYNGGDYDVFVLKLNSSLTSLLASTFLGGAGDDRGNSIAIDGEGNVYMTGITSSTDFPTTSGAYDTSHNGGQDVFVSKFNSGLTSLLLSTFLGGGNDDMGNSIVRDEGGNIYVTGLTVSSGFPTTSGAYDTSHNGDRDVFVAKFNSGLTSLLASTFLGGTVYEACNSIAIDGEGNVYMTGITSSTDFPTTSGAYDTSHNGSDDGFVAKFNSGLTSLLASTLLGGSVQDQGNSLAIEGSGNVYVTGWTFSSGFPTTSGAYDTAHDGDHEVFVSKFNISLTDLLASTFLGGSNLDDGNSLAIDEEGNVYVEGSTSSSDFPTTSGAYDTTFNGSGDAFVSKFNSGLTNLLASTFLGGASGQEVGYSIAIDKGGNIYVTGWTFSSDFPTTSGAYDTSHNGDRDVFVSRLDSNLSNACGLAQASQTMLWPPDHKMILVEITRITDPNNDTVTVTITGVTQDEPVNGSGDGNMVPDAVIQGDKVLLRSERAANGNGRVYTVTFTADDGNSGTCSGAVKVCVPHNRKSTAIDDGQIYDSTLP